MVQTFPSRRGGTGKEEDGITGPSPLPSSPSLKRAFPFFLFPVTGSSARKFPSFSFSRAVGTRKQSVQEDRRVYMDSVSLFPFLYQRLNDLEVERGRNSSFLFSFPPFSFPFSRGVIEWVSGVDLPSLPPGPSYVKHDSMTSPSPFPPPFETPNVLRYTCQDYSSFFGRNRSSFPSLSAFIPVGKLASIFTLPFTVFPSAGAKVQETPPLFFFSVPRVFIRTLPLITVFPPPSLFFPLTGREREEH